MEDYFPLHDIVCSLKEVAFTARSIREQRDIVTFGRPVPELTATQLDVVLGRPFTRSFNPDQYVKNEWMCGSYYKQSLFCWPCLLLEQNESKRTVWTTTGYADYKNLCRAVQRHEGSREHISHHCNLKKIGSPNDLALAVSEHDRLATGYFNEAVAQNRAVMKMLINAVIYLGKQELFYQSPCKKDISDRDGNYTEVMDFLSTHHSYDILSHYRTNEPVFGKGCKVIQSELIECIQKVMVERIEQELSETTFFSFQMDDATDLHHRAQNSLVVRYVDGSSRVVERFLGFFDVSEDKSAASLFNLIETQLARFKYEHKLMGQSYDGGSVSAERLTKLQARVKRSAPGALLTHCSSHKLYLVLQSGCESIPECRKFFSQVQAISSYFQQSPLRASIADTFIGEIRWSSCAKVLEVIAENFEDLKTTFEAIVSDTLQSAESRTSAAGFLFVLAEVDFYFLASVFKSIFEKVDALFDARAKRCLDPRYCLHRIEALKNQLVAMRCDAAAENLFFKAVELIFEDSKRDNDDLFIEKTTLYFDIIDNFVTQLTERFSDYGKLMFLELADSSRFAAYKDVFPEATLVSLTATYPTLFPDHARLKIELEVMYRDADTLYPKKTVQEILDVMRSLELHTLLKEAYKLMLLIASISATSVTTKKSFPARKRIKKYLRSSMPHGRTADLSFMTIEKDFLGELMAGQEFYDRVIEKFMEKNTYHIPLRFSQNAGGASPMVPPTPSGGSKRRPDQELNDLKLKVRRLESSLPLSLDTLETLEPGQSGLAQGLGRSRGPAQSLGEKNGMRYFLLSLLPELETMSEAHIRAFKIKAMMLLDEMKSTPGGATGHHP